MGPQSSAASVYLIYGREPTVDLRESATLEFGCEKTGFADIAIGWLGCWVRMVEEIVGINLIDTESMAKLNAWFNDFLELPIIKECMPPRAKMLEHNKAFLKV